jgi:DNA helicase-2/ATP-dependent DNA helicase PcrA
MPSRFVGELPPEHVETENPSGLYGGQSSAYGGFRQSGSGFYATKAPLIEDSAIPVTPRPRPEGSFGPGDRVFHQKFGYGTVRAAEGDKLDIAFDQAGTKKVMDSFVVAAAMAR